MILFSWLKRKWAEYKENQKRRELYARLDRNGEGRFSKNKYRRDIKKVTGVMKKDKK